MGERRKPESVVPLPPGGRELATHIRSTMISSSITALRERDLFDRYVEALPAEHRDAILLTMAPSWLPMDVAEAHYAACDSLGLTAEDATDLGREVGERFQNSFIGTMARGSRKVGASPWIALEAAPKLWERFAKGGGISVERTGPKDARVQITGLSISRYAYCRFATAGILESAATVFAKKAFVRLVPELSSPNRMGFIGSWV